MFFVLISNDLGFIVMSLSFFFFLHKHRFPRFCSNEQWLHLWPCLVLSWYGASRTL